MNRKVDRILEDTFSLPRDPKKDPHPTNWNDGKVSVKARYFDHDSAYGWSSVFVLKADEKEALFDILRSRADNAKKKNKDFHLRLFKNLTKEDIPEDLKQYFAF